MDRNKVGSYQYGCCHGDHVFVYQYYSVHYSRSNLVKRKLILNFFGNKLISRKRFIKLEYL